MPSDSDWAKAIASARSLAKQGQEDEAQEILESVVEQAPHYSPGHLEFGRLLSLRRSPLAEGHLRTALELAPTDIRTLTSLASHLRNERRLDEAAEVLDAALRIEPGNVGAISYLAKIRRQQERRLESYVLFEKALELEPDNAQISATYADNMMKDAVHLAQRAAALDSGSARHARTLASTLARAGQFEEADQAYDRAITLAPDAPTTRSALREQISARRLASIGRDNLRKAAAWPRRVSQFQAFEAVVRQYVLPGARPASPLLGVGSGVVTMGSCFAEHVGRQLRERGIDVFYKDIGEDINSLWANRYLMDWVVEGPTNEVTSTYEGTFGAGERQLFGEKIREADVVIFSLGVAPAFFDRNTGDFVFNAGGLLERSLLHETAEFRMTTIAENVENLQRVIARLRELNPDINVVLTVSPVSLRATFERESAVLADTVSKSTLRLSVEEVLKGAPPRVHYWPSFEIVRWLGAHVDRTYPPVFGADDYLTRHVSSWLVNMIVALFVEYCSDGTIPFDEGPAEPA